MTHSSQDQTVLGTLYLLAPARAFHRYRNPRRRQSGAAVRRAPDPLEASTTPNYYFHYHKRDGASPVAGVALEANRP